MAIASQHDDWEKVQGFGQEHMDGSLWLDSYPSVLTSGVREGIFNGTLIDITL